MPMSRTTRLILPTLLAVFASQVAACAPTVFDDATALAVIGDRSWSSLGVLSVPKPFTSMPLSYERSFGGPGIDANPLGSPVPNIEDPRELITSPRSKPKPAGAFPIPPEWKSRQQRAGRYDKKWLATRWPYFPEDFDGSFFNAAAKSAALFCASSQALLATRRPAAPSTARNAASGCGRIAPSPPAVDPPATCSASRSITCIPAFART